MMLLLLLLLMLMLMLMLVISYLLFTVHFFVDTVLLNEYCYCSLPYILLYFVSELQWCFLFA